MHQRIKPLLGGGIAADVDLESDKLTKPLAEATK